MLQQLDVVQRGDVVVRDAADLGGALACNSTLSARTGADQVVPRLAAVLAP